MKFVYFYAGECKKTRPGEAFPRRPKEALLLPPPLLATGFAKYLEAQG